MIICKGGRYRCHRRWLSTKRKSGFLGNPFHPGYRVLTLWPSFLLPSPPSRFILPAVIHLLSFFDFFLSKTMQIRFESNHSGYYFFPCRRQVSRYPFSMFQLLVSFNCLLVLWFFFLFLFLWILHRFASFYDWWGSVSKEEELFRIFVSPEARILSKQIFLRYFCVYSNVVPCKYSSKYFCAWIFIVLKFILQKVYE